MKVLSSIHETNNTKLDKFPMGSVEFVTFDISGHCLFVDATSMTWP